MSQVMVSSSVNAGARLDRLPVSAFHKRVFRLVGLGMFFDGFDIYIAASVLGATLRAGFSTLAENAAFVSATFFGMMIGSLLTGFVGDRYGRRITYQANLALFGVAALLAAFAPNMTVLIILRFFMGVGLGAENVVGYATMTEFVPPATRGRWLGLVAVLVVTGLPATRWSPGWRCRCSAGVPCSSSVASAPCWCGGPAKACRKVRAGWKASAACARPKLWSARSRWQAPAVCRSPRRRIHRPRCRPDRWPPCSRHRFSAEWCWAASASLSLIR